MKRRQLLGGAGLTAIALVGCDEPASQPPQATSLHWRMLNARPDLEAAARRLVERIATLSDGRLIVELLPSEPQLEIPAQLAHGQAQLIYGGARHWHERISAAAFFEAQPFGLTALEMAAWLNQGGGQALWEQTWAAVGLQPLLAGNQGPAMGIWCNRAIDHPDALQGLKIHLPGLAGAALIRLGAVPVELRADEIPAALRLGALDAAGVMQTTDALPVARYCYQPGWQAPQQPVELLIDQQAWNGLPPLLQAILDTATRAATQDMLGEQLYQAALAQEKLRRSGTELRRFPQAVLAALQLETEKLLGELAQHAELNGRIWASQKAFQAQLAPLQALADPDG